MPCNHQKADSRIFLHVYDAAKHGHSKAFIRTVNSDVVLVATGHLWIGYGTGITFQYIPVHQVIQSLGPEKYLALSLMHSYTRCDTSLLFLGIGKKTAWAAYEVYPELTETLIALPEEPTLLTIDSNYTWNALDVGQLSCTVRALDFAGWIMAGVYYLRMSSVCLTTSPQLRQPYLNMLGGRCCRQPLSYGGKLRNQSSMCRKSRNGVGCKRRQPKAGCHFGQSYLMQTVPVRSSIIVGVQKPAEVTANVARQDSGALVYVTMKVDLSTIIF